jgi:hypothetical protein
LSIAAGSGAAVATDILTLWNGGVHANPEKNRIQLKNHDHLVKDGKSRIIYVCGTLAGWRSQFLLSIAAGSGACCCH